MDTAAGRGRIWSRYCDGRCAEPFEVARESAVAGQYALTPARGVVHGEDGTAAEVPERRVAQPDALATTTREVPDAAR
jgi:hypothetical protein